MDNHLLGWQGEHQHPREKGSCMGQDLGAVAVECGGRGLWISLKMVGLWLGEELVGGGAHVRLHQHTFYQWCFNKCLRTADRFL